MKKKDAENVKETEAKSKKNSGLQASWVESMGRPRANKPMKVTDDPRFAQAVQNYEAGLKALQSTSTTGPRRFSRRLLAGPSPELADRASVHLNTCNQQLNRDADNRSRRPKSNLTTPCR